jgi:ubiquinone/menaquinone biosynthesis C-methylase UbiE
MVNLKEFYNLVHKQNINKRFFDKSVFKRVSLALEALNRVPKNSLILDLGMGFGYSTKKLAEEHMVVGLDISSVAIKEAKKYENKNLMIVQANAETFLPFKERVFDAIFCGEFVEHISNTPLLFKEMNRILKRKGYLIVTTPNYSSLHYKIKFFLNKTDFLNPEGEHTRFYSEKSLTQVLQKNGFKIINKKFFGVLRGEMFFVSRKIS